MDRYFDLQQNEFTMSQRLEAEHRDLLARYGALKLQEEQIRARLPAVEDAQRNLINQAIARHGVTGFINARIAEGRLVCTMPDEQILPRVNGQEAFLAPDGN